MKKYLTETDRLAARMGYRIRRKRDGCFDVLQCDHGSPYVSLARLSWAEVEQYFSSMWEHGYTLTEPCGAIIRVVPPLKELYQRRRQRRPIASP